MLVELVHVCVHFARPAAPPPSRAGGGVREAATRAAAAAVTPSWAARGVALRTSIDYGGEDDKLGRHGRHCFV